MDLEELRELFDWIRERLRRRPRPESPHADRHHRIAMKSLYVAAEETQRYLSSVDAGGRSSPAAQERLSELWRDAAEAFRMIDPDLAGRCELKGMYWSDPNLWTQGDINAARISLRSMLNEIREFV